MADTTDNVVVEVFGDTAAFATDYGTSGTGFTNSHLNITKLAFGDETTTSRVYAGSPLPVNITGNTGNAIDVSGSVIYGSGLTSDAAGNFRVTNIGAVGTGATMVYLAVAGSTSGESVGVTGTIQGISGGEPVTVTGGVTVKQSVAIVGATGSAFYREFGATAGVTFVGHDGEISPAGGFYPVVVTGGRKLDSSTDSITVSGTVSATGGRFLAAGTDSVAVLGSDQGSKVLTRVYSGDGTTIGASGDALKVALTNTGVTFTFNVAATVGVTNSSEPPLKIQGYTGSNGFPVTVRGENDGAIEVAATSALNVNVNNSSLEINDDAILSKIGSTGDIYTKLNEVATNTASISTIRSDLQNGSASVTVNKTTKPGKLAVGSQSASVRTGAVQLANNTILGSGVTIKASEQNTAQVYVGSLTLTRAISNGYPLSPGESIFLEVNNTNLIYIRTESDAQTVNYIGS